MNNGKILLGFLSGVAIGALLGVLLAPYSGVKTRKKIKAKGDKYMHDLGDKVDSIAGSISKKYDSAKKEVMDTYEHGKAKLKSMDDL